MGARQEAVEQTRERILQATYDLWLVCPFDELTLENVADQAGVSRQTVHRQFGSKEELIAAVTEWRAPREDKAREVAPGDVAGAVRTLVERNEEMGDANVRMLQLEGRVDAVDHMLLHGRQRHREWLERVFASHLPRGKVARARAVMTLYAATDVMVWKLLRRDFGHSQKSTEEILRQLVEGALHGIAGGKTS